MSPTRQHRRKRAARCLGGLLMFVSWSLLTAAMQGESIPLAPWMLQAAGIVGTGLVLWGALKTKVDRNTLALAEVKADMKERVTVDLFTQAHGALSSRLGRIEDKLDRGHDREQERDREHERERDRDRDRHRESGRVQDP